MPSEEFQGLPGDLESLKPAWVRVQDFRSCSRAFRGTDVLSFHWYVCIPLSEIQRFRWAPEGAGRGPKRNMNCMENLTWLHSSTHSWRWKERGEGWGVEGHWQCVLLWLMYHRANFSHNGRKQDSIGFDIECKFSLCTISNRDWLWNQVLVLGSRRKVLGARHFGCKAGVSY